MDKKESKRLKKFMKEHLKIEPITSTQEQIQYLLEAYQEEGYVVGLYKS